MIRVENLYIAAVLFFSLLGCKYIDTNKKEMVTAYFKDLNSNLNPDSLYNKYFFKEEVGQEGRSVENINIYKDSLFKEIRSKIEGKSVVILSIKGAIEMYPTYKFNSNYYEAQANNIYVCIIDNKLSPENIYYVLVYGDKIISLLPLKTIDNKIIQWF